MLSSGAPCGHFPSYKSDVDALKITSWYNRMINKEKSQITNYLDKWDSWLLLANSVMKVISGQILMQ